MIEGLKIAVDSAELVTLCADRVKYHKQRAEVYVQQIESMKSNQVEGMNYTNGNPINSLEDRRSSHENEAAEMQFIANHIKPSETYILSQQDLVKLGITKSKY